MRRSFCKAPECGAAILWAVTPYGKPIPLNPDRVVGNIKLIQRDPPMSPIAEVVKHGEGQYTAHFDICTSPEAFRRRKLKNERKAG